MFLLLLELAVRFINRLIQVRPGSKNQAAQPAILRAFFFLTPDSGIVAGDNGTIILTTNGGNSWFTDNTFISPPGRNFKSVSCIHKESQTYSVISDSLFIVSNEEIIVADVEQNETFIISGYLLSQNYPNPFNPSTKISWQSPVSGHQTLKIYDVLGNEVATLVDEYREAGRYELLFDASNLSSGIYFYRLEAGSFVETKKNDTSSIILEKIIEFTTLLKTELFVCF